MSFGLRSGMSVLLGLFYPLFGYANFLDWIPNKQSVRVGVYVGTFDPPHLSHVRIVTRAIELGFVDYVLFLPNDKTSYKPLATPFHLRHEMALAAIETNSNLFTPKLPETVRVGYITDTILELKKHKPKVKLVGMMGTDVAEIISEIPPERKVWMTLVDSFLVNERQGYDPHMIPSTIEGRPVMTFVSEEGGLSSTRMKELIQTNTTELYQYLDSKVIKIIGQYHLWSDKKSCRLLYLHSGL